VANNGVADLVGSMALAEQANQMFPSLSIETDVVISPDSESLVVAARVTTPRGLFTAWSGLTSFEELGQAIDTCEERAVEKALARSLVGVEYEEEEVAADSAAEPMVEAGLGTSSGGVAECEECGKMFGDYIGATVNRNLAEIIEAGQERFGKVVCVPCFRELDKTEKVEAKAATRTKKGK
jgi:hypothetical protein